MGSTVERVAWGRAGAGRAWGALYLLLGFTLGLPAWVGTTTPSFCSSPS